MRKLFYLLLISLAGSSLAADAAPGDTTWVQATNRRFDRGNGYGNYDTSVQFPAGATSYRKVYMIFTLGKYACPGYDPNNPGEGAGQTGWCGDWDYDVHNIIMTPAGDTFELGRLITPYARQTAPRTPLNWTQRYVFDVTDFYPVLKNAATMRVFYSGYSTGFTGDIKFAFVEGTPERDVIGLDRVWHGGYNYGHGSVPINTALTPLTKTVPAGTKSATMKFLITGHGGDNLGCAEFCPNTYTLSLNGTPFVTQNFWRDDCSGNHLYPQSGTWIYNRANWCPGDLVHNFEYPLNGVTPSTNYDLGISFPPYTSVGGNQASYKVDGAVVYYGDFHHGVDAELADIIAPTNAEWHYRHNPVVGSPIIKVRNAGGTALSSVRIEYGVAGRPAATYTWNGTLNPLQSAEIRLPELPELKLPAGTYRFFARILQANGGTDAYAQNDSLQSTFTAAPMWPSEFIVQFRNNNQTNSITGENQTQWRIEDMDGNIVRQKKNCPINSLCLDTVSLTFGKAYRMVVSDTVFEPTNAGYYDIPSGQGVLSPHGDGLRFGSASTGYIRVRRRDVTTQLPMPGASSGGYEGNFGFGFVHHFYTGWPTDVAQVPAPADAVMQAYPNPAASRLSVFIDGLNVTDGQVVLSDLLGRPVMQQSYSQGIQTMDISAIAAGVYQLTYRSTAHPDVQLIRRVVIAR